MVPPPTTTSLQLATVYKPVFGSLSLTSPTTTPPPLKVISNSLGKNEVDALITTTIENDVTCGWYSGVISHAFECSNSLSCATNTDNIIACSKRHDENAFFSTCRDFISADLESCSVSGVLCCNSIDPLCMTLIWTADPTRSLVGCNKIHSTWVMLDSPFGLDMLTSISASDYLTSTSSSSGTASLSDTSQLFSTSGTHSSDGGSPTSPRNPSTSAPNSSGGNTATPAPGFGPPTYTVTTSAAPNTNTTWPINPLQPNYASIFGFLTTGQQAGIGVGATVGLIIIVVLITVSIKKYRARANAQHEESQNGTGGPLQDNPSGELPADIAPPARLARTLSTGWVSNHSSNFFDIAEGASEVPVDMRGQGVGAVELPGSPVEMAPIGIAQSQYNDYQAQASQYRRGSSINSSFTGPRIVRDLPREDEP